jgi:predicted nucleotidyltransferase
VRPSKALEHRQLEVIDLLDRRGITDPQLIGPVARREDSEGDPIEILARLPDGMPTSELDRHRRDLEALLGFPVRLVAEEELQGEQAEDVRREARPGLGWGLSQIDLINDRSILPGWRSLLLEAWHIVRAHGAYIITYKEKWGGLTITWGGDAAPGLNPHLERIERRSYEVCEGCGAPGTLRKGSWWMTLCDPCAYRYYTLGEWEEFFR